MQVEKIRKNCRNWRKCTHVSIYTGPPQTIASPPSKFLCPPLAPIDAEGGDGPEADTGICWGVKCIWREAGTHTEISNDFYSVIRTSWKKVYFNKLVDIALNKLFLFHTEIVRRLFISVWRNFWSSLAEKRAKLAHHMHIVRDRKIL